MEWKWVLGVDGFLSGKKTVYFGATKFDRFVTSVRRRESLWESDDGLGGMTELSDVLTPGDSDFVNWLLLGLG